MAGQLFSSDRQHGLEAHATGGVAAEHEAAALMLTRRGPLIPEPLGAILPLMLDGITIDPLTSDAQIRSAFPLMAELRDRIRQETFLEEVRTQEAEGYGLLGLYAHGTLVALAGVRRQHTLSRGPHAFVDDLVTHPDHRGKGYGTELLKYVAVQAAANGLPRVYLDARATALGFYDKLKFHNLTAVPCWIESDTLAATR